VWWSAFSEQRLICAEACEIADGQLLGDESDPSPGPRRLVKTPDAAHPLPKGEGYNSDWRAPDVTSQVALTPGT